jgi:(E)-4-hydroxy-3-methylbut-2-enyl-diphosphate synthase
MEHSNIIKYSRRISRVVKIGNIFLGGNNPVRIQSMTTTNTMDTIATVEQSIRMINAGCEYVRITTPSTKEAENLVNIKRELKNRGYDTPLIADVHYTPKAAEIAAQIIEKVRINPGNFADKKRFISTEYSDTEYNLELERIHGRFSPLVKICKENGTAMRIGSNHGSLSDRIMNRYGDSPQGMVESAMEFLRICEDHNYHEIVLSMKSSNPIVMVQAYRLLVKHMDNENMNYPLHLGVTEAGEGNEGRIKSAVGIGTLLEEGLGDTIRVSLTEEPEYEIPVAKKIVSRFSNRVSNNKENSKTKLFINPFEFKRRKSNQLLNIGWGNLPIVISNFSRTSLGLSGLNSLGYEFNRLNNDFNQENISTDYVYCGRVEPNSNMPKKLGVIYDYNYWKSLDNQNTSHPILKINNYEKLDIPHFVEIDIESFEVDFTIFSCNAILILQSNSEYSVQSYKSFINNMMKENVLNPVIIRHIFMMDDTEEFQINASTEFGVLLTDGMIDGIWIEPSNKLTLNTAFGILQATRARITKTDYISCPSCGRTLFNLQEVSAKIREKTAHLVGLKIGIMGCIVNGPGEMADADYGYVGVGDNKISLYRGQEVVQKNIPSDDAVNALIELIKSDGKWK